jgi:glutamate---cysteine ligase / carboxylate-amine ligase
VRTVSSNAGNPSSTTLPQGQSQAGAITGELTNLGVEEELHVVDLTTRELVAEAPKLLDQLPGETFSDELHRSVVETKTQVCPDLSSLREDLVRSRRLLRSVADSAGLAVVAAGTLPLVDPLRLAVTSNSRYERMLNEYQVLVREQLICGAQVHVQISDRDVAVAVAQRVTPYLPLLLALSASSPYWMGEDTGYASMRSLLWQRWPTAGLSGEISSASAFDTLVEQLIESETITDPGMVYFDVRPSAHVPTLELRITDACPNVDNVIMLAGLFRALVRREQAAAVAGSPSSYRQAPLLRSALWRAARSGLEGKLLDLPRSLKPIPAAEAVLGLLGDLRDQLEDTGDWDTVSELVASAISTGSSAAQQRAACQRRGRLSDVVDLLIQQTDPDHAPVSRGESAPEYKLRLPVYERTGDEVLSAAMPAPGYAGMLDVFERLGPAGLRKRQHERDEEQRSNGVTFGVDGRASNRLFPVDLLPRLIVADEWTVLQEGLKQRARTLDAFLHDVYGQRAAVADGIVPEWVIQAAPGFNGVGALMNSQRVRATIAGMDLVRDGNGEWFVLEDNLRVPSGLGYAVQNRRLSNAVMADLPRPSNLMDVENAPAMLAAALAGTAPWAASDNPAIALLSEGSGSSAWFEHQMLAREMGVPLAVCSDLMVDNKTVYLVRDGARSAIDVLYLRLDEDALLHLPGADGRPIGAGLLSAVHASKVALANAPGNGVGDDKAVYAFIPELTEYYLGERPLLNSVPTYLCGVADQRAAVLERLDQLVLKPVDGYGGQGVMIGPLASEQELEQARSQLIAAPHRWIAQDMVALSTHPSFDNEALVPRHVDLRAFVFQGDGVQVAPAALTRVAPPDSMVVNSSRGGGSKDTWLLA